MPAAVISSGSPDGIFTSLAGLLVDAVASGASIGFLAPLTFDEAVEYWNTVREALGPGRILLAWFDEAVVPGELVGTVQLDLCARANGLHRAEVMKLMVHRDARGRGIGRMLMHAAEQEAARHGRTLLVLDTRRGDVSERLYRSLGYVEVGVIPGYARSSGPAGELHDTVIFYKNLG